MRIVYLTQWFDPEPNVIKGIAFVRALEAAGHDVTVVTGFPNYPTGRLYPGYRIRLIQREEIAGVRVVRLPLYPSHDASTLRRSLNYLSFFLSVLAWSLLRRERFDLAYVYHPPITVGLAAALAGLIRPLPFVLEIGDLWPDTVAATGFGGARLLAFLLGGLCTFVYGRARAIITQSKGIRRALIDRGVPQSKVTAIPLWANAELEPRPTPERTDGGRLTLVYGGSLGAAQALGTVIDAAAILERERSDFEIRLYGDGLEAQALRDRATSLGTTTVSFSARVRHSEIGRIFAGADALLLHLGDDPLFAITIPSKTVVYLCMGRPIVAGIAGEAAELLRESGAAFVAPPCDAPALARAIGALLDLADEQREAMGRSGLDYYRERFAFAGAMARTLAIVEGTHARDLRTELAATP